MTSMEQVQNFQKQYRKVVQVAKSVGALATMIEQQGDKLAKGQGSGKEWQAIEKGQIAMAKEVQVLMKEVKALAEAEKQAAKAAKK